MPEYNMPARERLKSERGGGDKEGEEVERESQKASRASPTGEITLIAEIQEFTT